MFDFLIFIAYNSKRLMITRFFAEDIDYEVYEDAGTWQRLCICELL